MNFKFVFYLSLLAFFLLLSPSWAEEPSPKGYIEMPPSKDGSYIMGRPGDGRRWGRKECIKALLLVAREWHRRHPKYILHIGDISNKTGTHFPPHKTHKDGLRIDITTRPNICHVTFKNQKLTLELARLFVRFGAWRIFYNHPFVTRNVPEVRKLVKHDDHFHVEFNVNKIPKGEGPFVISAPPVTENGWVGTALAKKTEDGWSGVRLAWSYLGATALRWQKEFQFELSDSKGQLLFATERTTSRKTFYTLEFPLKHNQSYRWKVTVWGRGGKRLSTGWIQFRTDFTPPKVTSISPLDGEKTHSFPKFSWAYQDSESTQHHFVFELDNNRSHSRLAWRSEAIWHKKSTFVLPMELPRKRSFYWRVVVWDGRGNRASSSWVKFYVKKRKKFKLRLATVKSKTLNLRKGPGTKYRVVLRLVRGQKIYIVRSHEQWLFVRLRFRGKIKEGFVHKDYVKE